MPESAPGDVIGGLASFEAWMKESLEIDQHRVLTGRDQVFTMKVACVQGVEKGETATLTPIEAGDLFCSFTRRGSNEFGPSVTAAIESFHCAKGRLGATIVEPGEKFLKVAVNG